MAIGDIIGGVGKFIFGDNSRSRDKMNEQNWNDYNDALVNYSGAQAYQSALKNYAEDNNVIINNKLYYKNTQFDLISQKVLQMCNIYSPKSKFNNTSHKSKGGKTMITKGMTVGEFEKKYNIQE